VIGRNSYLFEPAGALLSRRGSQSFHNPMPPMFCYLKPYYNDPNQSYFKQLTQGVR
jgi:hypothetical protein